LRFLNQNEIITHANKNNKAQVVLNDILSNDVRRLKLKANQGLDYSPGQFANLKAFEDGGTRSYSMAGVNRR